MVHPLSSVLKKWYHNDSTFSVFKKFKLSTQFDKHGSGPVTQTIDFIHTYIEEKHVEFGGIAMNWSSQSYPRQMGYYYPQQMQGYYQQICTWAILAAWRHYGRPDYYQPYAPIHSMPMTACIFQPLSNPKAKSADPHNFKVLCRSSKDNGQFDFNKMMDTTGQVMSAMNQVGSLIKGFTSFSNDRSMNESLIHAYFLKEKRHCLLVPRCFHIFLANFIKRCTVLVMVVKVASYCCCCFLEV